MMPAPRAPQTRPDVPLIARLPPVRGRVRAEAPLSAVTWFRVGGPAEVLVRPADADDLAALLAALPADVPVTVIGVGSNLLVRDGGVRGLVIRLAGGFADVHVTGDRVVAGAGALDATVAKVARDAGLAGLEFLSGIPGGIGGALRMNAGAYGREIKDVLVSARVVDRDGRVFDVAAADLGLSYRHSTAPPDWVFVGAVLQGTPGDPIEIAARMDAIRDARAASQPIRGRTGGSTFANPPCARAWELIEQAGCRGLRVGGAQVSEQHCNFLINTGEATAADLEALGETVRRRVHETCGVDLRWEIRRIGDPVPASGATRTGETP
ncbi:UDP-N-acetylmuramate dehydrogenase [Roseospira goensis]|uniref:UDP-N-acetylenolpyruvoylglucosamine reductase n=1 Tax=Roseospira goensis TaxID=391922 RepID=A0A7W6S0K0_9PROT|nr:UDP-N-acetylmuramate dehydrogenase [Roseospira goensis]MBB4286653.1 UDP-N-acetylmuramate dehydrogenase [Roseospira goensis]